MTMPDDIVVHLARFAGALRDHGVDAGIGDEVDATTALTLIDLFDRDEVRRALLVAFRIRPRDKAVFDSVFDRFWSVSPAGARPMPPVPGRVGSTRGGRTAGGVQVPASRHHTGRTPDQGHPGYTPDAVLRRKPFEECSDRDLAEMERLLSRLRLRWAARRSRTLKPVRGRGLPDLRRSFRRARSR